MTSEVIDGHTRSKFYFKLHFLFTKVLKDIDLLSLKIHLHKEIFLV